MHLPVLIKDLALILGVGGLMALLFQWLKQPVVLAFLLAGVLVGPQITLFPSVVERGDIQIFADLGVIFLLFVLGLEFSFRKVLSVGRTVLIAATFEVSVMILIGWTVGQMMNWSTMDSLFLGGIIAISSTTIILKSFQSAGVRHQHFATFVMGILIIEDLFAVLLLAVLSTVAVAKEFRGSDLLKEIGILLGFLAITFSIGSWVIPRAFRFLRGFLTDELRVVLSLGLCLGMVCASNWAGFSSALGAFVMGSLMGDTSEGERIERFLKPIRDLFGAIFFVSVGMLLDLSTFTHHLGLILMLATVVILGKTVSAGLGMRLAGQNRKVALQTGLSLSQIGEFSFIVGMLGMSLGVMRSELYPLAVSVALITTFTTPYFIRLAIGIRSSTPRAERDSISKPRLWDGHLCEFEIHPHSLFAGSKLSELTIREKFGTSIVAIARGDRKIIAPGRDELVMPFDRVVIMGTDEQLDQLEKFFRAERHEMNDYSEANYKLTHVSAQSRPNWLGKSLRESGIREKLDGMVLGIERNSEKILNPDSTMTIEKGDVLWIYARRDLLRAHVS